MNSTMTVDQYINNEQLTSATKLSNGSIYKVIKRDDKQTVFIPARDCLITSTVVTAKNKADLLAAVPYALEDELSQPVESLHFVAGEQDSTGVNPVIVTSKDNMQRWLGSAPKGVDCILPDVLALPWKESTWSVVIVRDRALARINRYQGFECERNQLKMQLALLKRQHKKPKALNIWLPKSMPGLDLPKDCADKIQGFEYQQSFQDWLQTSANPAYELNLLSGEFQANNADNRGFKPWLPAVGLVILAIVFHAGFNGYQINKINNKTNVLQQQISQLFQQAFPETKRVVNPRIQAEQNLKDMKAQLSGAANTDFLTLFANVMSVVIQQQGMNVKGFSWKQNQLQLQLMAASVSQVEQMETALSSKNLSVEMLNAVNKDGQFQAQLKIGEAP